ncbi:alpha/beta hydrolase [Nocardia veterana]|uniref:Alpha/beta hydrolase n=1 Tax=Nocardia veterana TaxID=132249 RepID=A0A7X6RJD8_9NOCA|nr:alpha/beta hydrolase [Nocardia veterana]NKY88116.1 alpha/beta hydrolase [Nocardia veterana]
MRNHITSTIQVIGARVLAAPSRWWSPLAPSRPVVDGQRLSPRLHVLATLGKRGVLARRPPSPAARARFDVMTRIAGGVVASDAAVTTIRMSGPAGPLRARLYEPAGLDRPCGLLVYVHGGGWHLGSAAGFDAPARLLAGRARVKVLSVDYRLAPEHPFPAAFDDVLAGYRFAVDHAASWGVDNARIAIGGDSAGGNLAAAVALHLGRDARYRPALAVLLYPVVDTSMAGYRSSDLFTVPLDRGCVERALAWYVPDPDTASDPRVCVLRAPDPSRMPDTHIATAGMDVLRDQGEALADRLGGAGVPVTLRRYDNLPHGFATMLADPRARAATEDIAGTVGERIGEHRRPGDR